jgi:preprotein translocase subunit SecD
VRHLRITIAALALSAGCTKQTAESSDKAADANKSAAADKGEPTDADKPAAADADKPAAADADKPADSEEAEVEAGLYPVRASAAKLEELVPAEGDHVVNLQDGGGTWHMLGMREVVPMTHVAKIVRDAPRGGVHYAMEMDDEGKAKMKALTTAQSGKPIAVVVDGAVVVTPEVEAVIENGQLTVSCGSGEASCIESMDALVASKGGAPE